MWLQNFGNVLHNIVSFFSLVGVVIYQRQSVGDIKWPYRVPHVACSLSDSLMVALLIMFWIRLAYK